VIVERPGTTNLYCVAWQGNPLGGTFHDTGRHDPRCPLRHPHRAARSTSPQADSPTATEVREGSEISDPLVTPGVSEAPDPQGSETSDPKTRENDRENTGAPAAPDGCRPEARR
jgi:hypothetical protein